MTYVHFRQNRFDATKEYENTEAGKYRYHYGNTLV